MNIKKMIGQVYKILEIYENEPYENYQAYLYKVICLFNGSENDSLISHAKMLRGLYLLGENVNHREVRSVVLHITNKIDKEV